MNTILTGRITERAVGGKPLGRHLEHNEASRAFRVTRHPTAPIVSKHWIRHGSIFVQEVGSCTCQALFGCVMTEPLYTPEIKVDEEDAEKLYELATLIDTIPGNYPPDDTGSTGLAAAKAAKREGYIDGYEHAFGLDDTLHALQKGPIIVGVTWYDTFDEPKGDAALLEITPEAEDRGGHEVEINEIDVPNRMLRGPNSWGDGWGDNGYFTMSFDTLDRLLKERGDVIRPYRSRAAI